MKKLYTVKVTQPICEWPTYISAIVNGVQLHNFNGLTGETGLMEYIRTHYTREDGSQLTIADIIEV
tara:strand:+ start:323 stop:520 length:198 start_codon:yes stop_codon:yes gene_type:complete